MEHYSAFATCPLFAIPDIRHLRETLVLMDIRFETFPKNAIVLKKGMVVQDILLVAEGNVLLQASDYREQLTNIGVMGRGEIFAEALAVSKERSPVDAISLSDETVIAYIPLREVLKDLTIAGNLLSIISARNLGLMKRSALLMQRTVRDRILFYLSLQKDIHHAKTFLVPMSKKELATLLCIDPSALSHELKKLQDDRLIKVERNLYTLV